jgi:dTDP-4-amino-4,6-dideoxygalactose transaminase
MLFCALVLTSRPHADLALFSLERIKTATALGGGVAVLRNSQVSNKMKRLHQSLYDSQTQAEFLWKVIKAAFIRIVGTSPNLYAVIALSCRWLGFNFDRVVSTSTRTFSSKSRYTLIERIRRRPSLALLKTLEVKIRSYRHTESSQQTKIEQCKMMSLLHCCSVLNWPQAEATHSWWLAPIMVPAPDKTSLRL